MRRCRAAAALLLVGAVVPPPVASAATVLRSPDGAAPRARTARASSPDGAGENTKSHGHPQKTGTPSNGTVPATDPTAADSGGDPIGPPDLFTSVGVRSPFCSGGGLSPAQEANCQVGGGPEHAHPVSAYQLDVHADKGGGIFHPVREAEGKIDSAFHHLVGWGWLIVLYTVKGMCMLVEAAFSLDLLSRVMGPLQGTLAAWQAQLGGPWLTLAIVLGGLMAAAGYAARRHAAETVGGIGGSLLLMTLAGVIVANPAGTIGEVSHLANQGAIGLVAEATSGGADQAKVRTSTGLARIFDATVTEPWAVLNFGDPGWAAAPPAPEVRDFADSVRTAAISAAKHPGPGTCAAVKKLTGDGGGSSPLLSVCPPGEAKREAGALRSIALQLQRARTNGEVWLSLPADSDLRDSLYDKVHKAEPDVVSIQSGFPSQRGAWLVIVELGTLGMILLYGWIAMRLFDASLALLLLVLCAAIVFLTAALGRAGRASAVGWLRATVGAAIARAFYALLLALTLDVVGFLALLQRTGVAWWLAALLQAVFAWSVFLKRNLILDRVSGGHHHHEHHLATAGALYGLRSGFRTAHDAGLGVRAAVAAPIGAIGWLAGQSTEALDRRREEREEAVQALAAEHAEHDAAELNERELAAARAIVARDEHIRGEIEATRRVKGVRDHDEQLELHKAGALDRVPEPAEEVARVLARREALITSRDPAEKVRQARKLVEQADERIAGEGRSLSDHDLQRRLEKLSRRLDKPADALEHDPALRGELERWRTEQGDRARDLLGALPDAADGRALDRAARHFTAAEVRERRRELQALRERVRRRAAHDRAMARNRRHARPR